MLCFKKMFFLHLRNVFCRKEDNLFDIIFVQKWILFNFIDDKMLSRIILICVVRTYSYLYSHTHHRAGIAHRRGHFQRKDDSCNITLAICNTLQYLFRVASIIQHTPSHLSSSSETPSLHPAHIKLLQCNVLPACPFNWIYFTGRSRGCTRTGWGPTNRRPTGWSRPSSTKHSRYILVVLREKPEKSVNMYF